MTFPDPFPSNRATGGTMAQVRKYATRSGAFLRSLLALFLVIPAHAQVSQEFHRTVPLPANGRVSLENINGNVEITGWERNEVEIDAVKRARDQQRLDEASIEVETGSDYVKIYTRYPQNRTNNNPASANYSLHVPQNARLEHISLVNGSLTVQKVTGDVTASLVNGKASVRDQTGEASISSVNGNIEANFTSLNNVRQIKFKSVNGSINVGLPASPNADVNASTVNGGIKSDFPLTVQGSFASHRLHGTLGSGGTHIDLSNVNGSIHLSSGGTSL
jgi:hypothetical protein